MLLALNTDPSRVDLYTPVKVVVAVVVTTKDALPANEGPPDAVLFLTIPAARVSSPASVAPPLAVKLM